MFQPGLNTVCCASGEIWGFRDGDCKNDFEKWRRVIW